MLSGEVEADEAFVCGKARNMHAGKRDLRITRYRRQRTRLPSWAFILERGGKVR